MTSNSQKKSETEKKIESNMIIYSQIYDERMTNFNEDVFLVFDVLHLL